MKKSKKVLSGLLALTTAASAALTVYAATEHWNDGSQNATVEWTNWKTQWETIKDDYEKVSLTPGEDETKLNFAWYSKTDEIPAVRISTSQDMSGATEFSGLQTVVEASGTNGYYCSKVIVENLSENTQYYYQVFKNGKWNETEKYSTKSFDSYSIFYVGDPQIGACKGQISSENDKMADELAARNDAFNWNKTLNNALAAHPNVSFMLSAGDQVNNGASEYEYAGYLSADALSSLPVSTTIGNHDSGSSRYSYHFNNPNSFDNDDEIYALGHSRAGTDYYYTYGDVLFIVIDTNNYNCATHKSVIEKAISENEDAKWRVVMFHQDIYGSGLDHSDSDGIILRTQLTPIFDDNNIDIVLQGHDHTYSRTYQLSGDGNEHKAYDKNNYKDDENFLAENNCYVINSSAEDGNRVIDPEGIVYMEANSSTGSKFYNLIDAKQDYIAERSQTWTPSYSVIDFTETTATITTYDADSNEVLAGSSAYTIVKKANSESLAEAIKNAQAKLNDGAIYTEDSIAALSAAIQNAQSVIDNEESTSNDIANAEADIAAAAARLKIYEAPDDNSSETSSSEISSSLSGNSSQSGADVNSSSAAYSSSKTDSSNVSDLKPGGSASNPHTGILGLAPFAVIASLAGLAGIAVSDRRNKK